jgi:starch synthase
LIAKAIEKCLASPQRAKKMGEAGYRKVESDFTFEHQTRRLEQIYQDIMSERGK